jgi:Zinc knuckle
MEPVMKNVAHPAWNQHKDATKSWAVMLRDRNAWFISNGPPDKNHCKDISWILNDATADAYVHAIGNVQRMDFPAFAPGANAQSMTSYRVAQFNENKLICNTQDQQLAYVAAAYRTGVSWYLGYWAADCLAQKAMQYLHTQGENNNPPWTPDFLFKAMRDKIIADYSPTAATDVKDAREALYACSCIGVSVAQWAANFRDAVARVEATGSPLESRTIAELVIEQALKNPHLQSVCTPLMLSLTVRPMPDVYLWDDAISACVVVETFDSACREWGPAQSLKKTTSTSSGISSTPAYVRQPGQQGQNLYVDASAAYSTTSVRTQSGPNSVMCYKCGRVGHMIIDCTSVNCINCNMLLTPGVFHNSKYCAPVQKPKPRISRPIGSPHYVPAVPSTIGQKQGGGQLQARRAAANGGEESYLNDVPYKRARAHRIHALRAELQGLEDEFQQEISAYRAGSESIPDNGPLYYEEIEYGGRSNAETYSWDVPQGFPDDPYGSDDDQPDKNEST